MASRDFRRPSRGSDSMFATNRWLAPPANVQCPFGTSRSLSRTSSRDSMPSRRFEVEDFAKQIRDRRSFIALGGLRPPLQEAREAYLIRFDGSIRPAQIAT